MMRLRVASISACPLLALVWGWRTPLLSVSAAATFCGARRAGAEWRCRAGHSCFLLHLALLKNLFSLKSSASYTNFWYFLPSRSYWHLFPPRFSHFLPFFGYFRC